MLFSYWCISFLYFTQRVCLCHLSDIKPCALAFFYPFVFLFKFFPRPFLEWSRVYFEAVLPRCSFLWWDFCCRVLFQEVSSFVWGSLFLFFLSSLLVWCCLLPIPSTCFFFLFSVSSDSFLICLFYFFYLSFSSRHYELGRFFNAKFHSYFLAVYSYR